MAVDAVTSLITKGRAMSFDAESLVTGGKVTEVSGGGLPVPVDDDVIILSKYGGGLGVISLPTTQ